MSDTVVTYTRNPDTQHVLGDGGRLAVPMETGNRSFVATLYAHEYDAGGKTYRIPSMSLDNALRDLDMLEANRGIRGRVIQREVTVSVTEWKAIT